MSFEVASGHNRYFFIINKPSIHVMIKVYFIWRSEICLYTLASEKWNKNEFGQKKATELTCKFILILTI